MYWAPALSGVHDATALVQVVAHLEELVHPSRETSFTWFGCTCRVADEAVTARLPDDGVVVGQDPERVRCATAVRVDVVDVGVDAVRLERVLVVVQVLGPACGAPGDCPV